MRAAGLRVDVEKGYAVATLGADLLKCLNDLQTFAGKWATSRAKASVEQARSAKS